MPVSLFRRQLLSSSEIKDEEGKTNYKLIKMKPRFLLFLQV